jgi:sugar phosphate isomerase/epimerase
VNVARGVFWAAPFGRLDFRERVALAAANGYRSVSASLNDPADGRAIADDAGIELAVLDGVSEWYAHEAPKRPLGMENYSVDDVLRGAEQLGVDAISAIAPFPTDVTTEAMVGGFAALCDRAAEHGLRVQLEFTAFPAVDSLAMAWEIVRLADRANGGIVLDTWHFFRGDPDFDVLASVPGERIFAVQVSDGAKEVQGSLVKDTFLYRRLPGEGSFDLGRVIGVLRETGGLNDVGPEVMSAELAELAPSDAARRTAEAMDRLFSA